MSRPYSASLLAAKARRRIRLAEAVTLVRRSKADMLAMARYRFPIAEQRYIASPEGAAWCPRMCGGIGAVDAVIHVPSPNDAGMRRFYGVNILVKRRCLSTASFAGSGKVSRG
jgi:hypothetical protein